MEDYRYCFPAGAREFSVFSSVQTGFGRPPTVRISGYLVTL